MPRIENIGENVDVWCEINGEGSSTFDVCLDCADDLAHDSHQYDEELSPYNGDPDGSDGRGGDVEHPSYTEGDYECEVCGAKLYEEDD